MIILFNQPFALNISCKLTGTVAVSQSAHYPLDLPSLNLKINYRNILIYIDLGAII